MSEKINTIIEMIVCGACLFFIACMGIIGYAMFLQAEISTGGIL